MVQSFDEWKNSQGQTQVTNSGSVKPVKVQSFDEWKSSQPAPEPKPQGFLSKAIGFGKAAVEDAYKTVIAKPATRLAQAVAAPIVYGFGSEQTKKNYEDVVSKPMNIPGPVFTSGTTVEPQKAFGQGGATQIASDALKSASYLAPAGRIEGAASNLVKGEVKKATLGTAASGGIFGVLGGAGNAMAQDNPTVGSVAKEAAVEGVVGTITGGLLGLGGGMLASKFRKPTPQPKVAAAMDVVKPKSVTPANPNWNQDLPLPVNPNPDIPYIPNEQLPTIQMGSKAKPSLPTISMDAPVKKPIPPKGMKYEPIKPPVSPRTVEYQQPILSRDNQVQPPTQPVASTPTPEIQPQQVPTTSKLTPVQGTGELKVRGLAKSLEDKLQKTLGNLPEYNVVGNEGQFKNVAEIASTDIERAKRIALGQEAPPQGTYPEAFYVAMAERAKNDPALALSLGKSSALIEDATVMGQRLQLLSNLNPDSPVNVIRDIQKTFDSAATKKYGNINSAKKAVINEIDAVVKKSTPKVEDWNSFITSITC